MAKSRESLQSMLEDILGSRNVYFQKPSNVQMNYPAIVYTRERINNRYANDKVYIQNNVYRLIVMDKNPDSEIVKVISKLPMCSYNNHYVSDNIHHDVFTLNY